MFYRTVSLIFEHGGTVQKKSLKERQIELKRDFIIEVAKELFFSKGYEATSIDEIALTAEMSKSTLYTYVKSKEELFMHIHLEGMQERYDLLRTKMLESKTGYAKIYTFGREYFNFYKSNPGYFKLHIYEDYNTLDKSKVGLELYEQFDELLNNIICIVREAFELGAQDGSITKDIEAGYLDKYLAYTLRAMLNVAFSPEKIKQIKDIFEEEKFYFQYLDLFMKSVKGSC